jgi:hypothetical protein
LTLSGCIRRIVPPAGGKETFEYGVEFVLLEERDKLLLHAFVYQQLLIAT